MMQMEIEPSLAIDFNIKDILIVLYLCGYILLMHDYLMPSFQWFISQTYLKLNLYI